MGFSLIIKKKSRLYYLNHCIRIVEFGIARFNENKEVSGSMEPHKVEIQEVRMQVLLPITSSKIVVPIAMQRFNNFQ